MTKHEALVAMALGKRVRVISWLENGYLYMSQSNGNIYAQDDNPNELFGKISDSEVFEIYEGLPEVVTKRMAPAVVALRSGFEITYRLYETEDEARADNPEVFVKWLGETHFVDIDVPVKEG